MAGILFALSQFSPDFIPSIVLASDKIGLLLFGIGWGLVGGGPLEELGWTGFAVPALRMRYGTLSTGLVAGLRWGTAHFVIAFWSSVSLSGGRSLTSFIGRFLAFCLAALPAYKVLMVWVYGRPRSLLVAMLMHVPTVVAQSVLTRSSKIVDQGHRSFVQFAL